MQSDAEESVRDHDGMHLRDVATGASSPPRYHRLRFVYREAPTPGNRCQLRRWNTVVLEQRDVMRRTAPTRGGPQHVGDPDLHSLKIARTGSHLRYRRLSPRNRGLGQVGASVAFKSKPSGSTSSAATPLDLYNSGRLPRTQSAVEGLWFHQGEVLQAWHAVHETEHDLALELPTGTGKTLTGLIIAEWVRRTTRSPVVYACPTTQLAGQVADTAAREGIPAVLLTGSHRNWAPADDVGYSSSSAVCITNYSTVFNSSPKLAVPHLLVLDDAHAGEQFVGEQLAVNIRRQRDPAAYHSVLAALRPMISPLLLQRLQGSEPDPGAHHQVRLLLPAVHGPAMTALDAALAELDSPYSFQFAMIRGSLHASCVFLSYGAILVRPLVPPTFENPVFAGAGNRLYLSATLGHSGELERSFGRSEIARIPSGSGGQPRSGRRLFVFPDVAAGGDSDGLVRALLAITRKAVVLTQDTIDNAVETASSLAPAGVPVLGKADIAGGLTAFSGSLTGVLGLANRYDGLDFPGDACRMVVLDGLPNAHNLQEKFLGERADAGAALAERLRTRVVQGAGRCTRQPNDFAVVVIRGVDITRYLANPDVQAALDSELHAEVQFGWDNSIGVSHHEIVANVKMFLAHDEEWRAQGEPALAEFREGIVQVPPAGSAALQTSAPLEVEAWAAASQESWAEASDAMQRAARTVGTGGEATRGYRAVLLYLAGVWLHYAASSEAERGRARELVAQANAAAARGVWLREMTALPQEPRDTTAADDVAVNAVSAMLAAGVKADKHAKTRSAMVDGLLQVEFTTYEASLTALGALLGAQSSKPDGPGRCDSAWLWDTQLWMSVEAKSEAESSGTIPLKDIRQTNTQLDQIAADNDRPYPPADSYAILISPRGIVAPGHASVANPNVYLVSPEEVAALARDAAAVWEDLIPRVSGQPVNTVRGEVGRVLSEYGCLPSQVAERLSRHRIRPEV